MDSKRFCRHLHEINESYWQHFIPAATSGLKVMLAGFILIIHALLPFLFLTTGSTMIKNTAEFFKRRAAAAAEKAAHNTADS